MDKALVLAASCMLNLLHDKGKYLSYYLENVLAARGLQNQFNMVQCTRTLNHCSVIVQCSK